MTSTPNDPVIDEIREVRHRISERCNHDPMQLVAYYMKLQERHQDRMIDSPKLVEHRDPCAVLREEKAPATKFG
ncbi:MAG: hypothetical protein WCJ35_26445 [Planctomycetota bacterium]